MNHKRLLIQLGAILLIICVQVQGAVKRCYKCRSRGDLGDCRNPFYADIEARQRASGARNPFLPNNQDPWGRQIDPYNRPDPFDAFQSGSLSSGVEAIPCSSGWCAKVIEGRGTFKADEYGLATERMCLQRPPQDLRERCATTVRGNQEVYMCFCQGDLCNGQQRGQSSSTFALLLSITLSFFIFTRLF